MTDKIMNLRSFVEKSPDAILLREMIGFAAERLMELEVGARTDAGYGEKRSAANPLYRHAQKCSQWQTFSGCHQEAFILLAQSPQGVSEPHAGRTACIRKRPRRR